jgi:hypothetical protein
VTPAQRRGARGVELERVDAAGLECGAWGSAGSASPGLILVSVHGEHLHGGCGSMNTDILVILGTVESHCLRAGRQKYFIYQSASAEVFLNEIRGLNILRVLDLFYACLGLNLPDFYEITIRS